MPSSDVSLVTPGYFTRPRHRAVSGRLLDEHDDDRRAPAAVVSETFARQFFAGEDPIGRRIAPARPARAARGRQAPPPNWLTIVGVVRDVKSARLEANAAPLMYRSVCRSRTST